MKMFRLDGKKALITGSTQGIGFSIAKLLKNAGACVIVHGATSVAKTENAAVQIGADGFVVKDLAMPDAADFIYNMHPDIDILVLNASVQFRTPWNEIGESELLKQLNVNFSSSLMLMQKYFPHMKEHAFGRILTVGSVQQYRPHKDMAVYAATKEAQMSLVKNIAKQVSDLGITVNNLCPGVIATPRNEDALSDPIYREKVLSGIPVGYAGSADDCAYAALYLCSNEARYVTGSEIIVDGGMHL